MSIRTKTLLLPMVSTLVHCDKKAVVHCLSSAQLRYYCRPCGYVLCRWLSLRFLLVQSAAVKARRQTLSDVRCNFATGTGDCRRCLVTGLGKTSGRNKPFKLDESKAATIVTELSIISGSVSATVSVNVVDVVYYVAGLYVARTYNVHDCYMKSPSCCVAGKSA